MIEKVNAYSLSADSPVDRNNRDCTMNPAFDAVTEAKTARDLALCRAAG
jgi:hypothetical protein